MVSARVAKRRTNKTSEQPLGFKDLPEYCYRIMAETTNTYIVSALLVTVLTTFHILNPQRCCEVHTVSSAIFEGSEPRHKRSSKLPRVTQVEYSFLSQVKSLEKHCSHLSVLCLISIMRSSHLCDLSLCEGKLLNLISFILHSSIYQIFSKHLPGLGIWDRAVSRTFVFPAFTEFIVQ